MNETPTEPEDRSAPARCFVTTHWSVVLEAQRPESPEARAALTQLCRSYWYPLYAYVRRQGHSPEESEDLTQEFFCRLLEKNYVNAADRSRGRFRTFLLTALQRFLAKEWRDARAQKRGGGREIISLDAAATEERYRLEPAHDWTAQKIYERRWAMTLLENTLTRLRSECETSGKSALFNCVKANLSGETDGLSYAEAARQLGLTEAAVKVAAHRLRQRYGELLREEVAQTVASPDELEEELRHLSALVRG